MADKDDRFAGFSPEAARMFREAEDLPPPPELQAQMDSEAETSAELMRDSSVHDRVMGMESDEFEDEFADVLHANAHDDEGALEGGPGRGVAGALSSESSSLSSLIAPPRSRAIFSPLRGP